jgi:nucleoid-associated protein YgaU
LTALLATEAALPQPATPTAASQPVESAIPLAPVPAAAAAAVVQAAPDGALTYIARSGDTLSELAVALLGKDSKANRDIIVNANPSLQANPDLVVIG